MTRVVAVLVVCLAACVGGGSGLRRPSALDLMLAPVNDQAAFSSPAVQGALDRLTGSRSCPGNEVTLLVNRDAFERRLANARDAEVILAKTFQILDDETGRQVAALLSERARAGAYVVLQYEYKTSIGGLKGIGAMLRNATPDRPLGEPPIIHAMRQAGVIIVPTNSPTRAIERHEWADNLARLSRDPDAALDRSAESLAILNHSDHEKYWITGKRDGAGRLVLSAILGGTNFTSSYAFGGTPLVDPISKDHGWHDVDVEVRGPVVNPIVERFFALMDYHLGRTGSKDADAGLRAWLNQPQAPVGPAVVRFVWNQPLVQNTRAVEQLYRVLIDATPKGGVVRVETPYFAPDTLIREALHRALLRGTRLTVVTNSRQASNHRIVSDAGRGAFLWLLNIDPTVALLERAPRPDIGEDMIHCKIASFGTRGPVVIGSANLDSQSGEHNSESVLLIDDPDFRENFDDLFLRDIAADRVDRVTLQDLAQEPPLTRFWQWSAYHLAGYWL